MHVGVFGAGAIGCYLGIRLSAAGVRVTLLGRQSLVDVADRVAAVSLAGTRATLAADATVTADAAALADVDLCLVTVKSGGTQEAGRALADVLSDGCTVVSMQNGLRNATLLRDALGDRVAAGMVPFNVFRDDEHQFTQATSGALLAERSQGSMAESMRWLQEAFARAGDVLELRDDMPSVAAGKLLLNLNNGICAATGLTIAESLRSRDARWCFAACMREGVRILGVTGPAPAKVVALPAWAIARMLSLPNFVVMRVAKQMVKVDPSARSSTLQDVLAGRRTEIDVLNGAIAELAQDAGLEAPANATVTRLVHGLYGRHPPPFLDPRGLRAEIERALGA